MLQSGRWMKFSDEYLILSLNSLTPQERYDSLSVSITAPEKLGFELNFAIDYEVLGEYTGFSEFNFLENELTWMRYFPLSKKHNLMRAGSTTITDIKKNDLKLGSMIHTKTLVKLSQKYDLSDVIIKGSPRIIRSKQLTEMGYDVDKYVNEGYNFNEFLEIAIKYCKKIGVKDINNK